jgi:hypothetical protein
VFIAHNKKLFYTLYGPPVRKHGSGKLFKERIMKFEYRIVAYKQREYIWIWEIAKFLIIEIA